MRPISVESKDVEKYLRDHGPTSTQELLDKFQCSPATLYTKLKGVPYISSCNKNNKYHTLSEMAEYDRSGLWSYEGIIFSKLRTIKETIQQLVNCSEAGLSTSELNSLLKTKVTPQLVSSVKERRVVRIRYGRHQVYYSTDLNVKRRQIERRIEMIDKSKKPEPFISNKRIIQILVLIVKHHAVTQKQVREILSSEGISVSDKELGWIFTKYEIEKKGAL